MQDRGGGGAVWGQTRPDQTRSVTHIQETVQFAQTQTLQDWWLHHTHIDTHACTPTWLEHMHLGHIGRFQVTQQVAAAHDWMHFFSYTLTLGQVPPHIKQSGDSKIQQLMRRKGIKRFAVHIWFKQVAAMRLGRVDQRPAAFIYGSKILCTRFDLIIKRMLLEQVAQSRVHLTSSGVPTVCCLIKDVQQLSDVSRFRTDVKTLGSLV